MHYILRIFLGLSFLVASMGSYAEAQTLAFPGAEGFGRFAKGGRGGRVIEVTNLNDSGSGSLRAAIDASGPRTVVFRVAGTINLTDRLTIRNPFVTIAGQTAPGGGIQLKGGGLRIKTGNVIVRYIRIRPGPSAPSPQTSNAIIISSTESRNIIIDHVSMSWAVDQVNAVYGGGGSSDITIQWSFITESLNCAQPSHPEGCHGKGSLLGGGMTRLSYHHNLLAHHPDRNPLLQSGESDIVNNVIYYNGNIGMTLYPVEGRINTNLVANRFILHSTPVSLKAPIRLMGGQRYNSGSGVYLKGNIHPDKRPNNSLPEDDAIRRTSGSPDFPITGSRYSYPNISTTDAYKAEVDVLALAGATLPVRDGVDKRIVSEVKNKTGKIIDSPSQVGGYPILLTGSPPTDSDHDGMPNSWEVAHGFNPNDDSDGTQDADSDGYTNLEEFLNKTSPGSGSNSPPDAPENLRITAVN
ncbi:pectate lyase family protein [Nitrospira sp. M1]